MSKRLKLNLGCGQKQFEGWVNVDRRELEGVDRVLNLDRIPWPWADGCAIEIRALHIIEHLRCGLVAFCDECWRLLYPGGVLYVKVPDAGDPDLSWCDPEHVRPYRRHSFINYLTTVGVRRFGYTDKPWCIMNIKSEGGVISVHMMPVPKEAAES